MGRIRKKIPHDVVALARAYTKKNIEILGGYATAVQGVDPEIQLRAIGMLLDRAHGKAPQQHEAKVDGTIEVVLRDVAAELAAKRKKP